MTIALLATWISSPLGAVNARRAIGEDPLQVGDYQADVAA
jgi:hypothetical protein